jgi:hypothetical protein
LEREERFEGEALSSSNLQERIEWWTGEQDEVSCLLDKSMLSDCFSPPDAELYTVVAGRRQEMVWSVWTSVCHVASDFHPTSHGRLVGFCLRKEKGK